LNFGNNVLLFLNSGLKWDTSK